MLNGHDVTLFDPDPQAERKVGEVMANARRAYAKLTMAPWPAEGSLRIVTDVAEAMDGAQFVQESAPERLELKQALLAEASALLGPDVVIGSSTSGLLPSDLQRDMTHPERLVVGHPFNPVYLMPLVEVVGGAATSDASKQRAAEVYRSIGMHPLVLGKEIDGFVADRLMEALWREALWLVNDGVATTAEIDDAIRFGPGLRWSFMGTFLTYRIAGGEAGMRHFMAQFGPTLQWPWTKLMDVPELTDELLDTICRSERRASRHGLHPRARSSCATTASSRCSTACETGSMRPVPRCPSSSVSCSTAARRRPPMSISTFRSASTSALCPPTGSTTTATPTTAATCRSRAKRPTASSGSSASMPTTSRVATATSASRATSGTCTRPRAGDPLYVTAQLLAHDEKRLRVFTTVHRATDDVPVATAEHMLLHVDTTTDRTCPAAPSIMAVLDDIASRHSLLSRPTGAGRGIGQPRAAPPTP